MRLIVPLFVLSMMSVATPAAVQAASFDCSKATTPFERAICDFPELSAADDRLAKTFATAMGGLTPNGATLLRNDQRVWLDFAQRACTTDAKPMTTGRYDEMGSRCLRSIFGGRSIALEQSRMLDGHRFFIASRYAALPDPDEVDNEGSAFQVATHELVLPQLDEDDPMDEAFNAFVMAQAANETDMVTLESSGDVDGLDAQSDTNVAITVKEVVGTRRITMDVSTYWYGHGAAHGNWTVGYLHYLPREDRGLVASDIFAGKNWQSKLVDIAWEQLQAEHGDALYIDTAGDIAESVVEPSRWDLSNSYGLVIQFQPYEVAAYAYGAPTITIAWSRLETIMAESANLMIQGF